MTFLKPRKIRRFCEKIKPVETNAKMLIIDKLHIKKVEKN